MKTKIKFAKVKEGAVIPTKRREDAGFDIYACFKENEVQIEPHETLLIPTGIASACSKKYCFILKERGSTGSKGIGQRCGVIDSGFRGEWFCPITNHNDIPLIISKIQSPKETNDAIIYPYHKAIAQAILVPVPKVKSEEVSYETLKNFRSERGSGCLGNSGK